MKKTKDEKIKLAFSFLDRGWSILPCGLDKRPLLSWKIWQTEYPSRETVKAWFEQFPEAQIGIITGKLSNLTVVDCEKGADPSILPQNTTIVKTGGEGYHYLYLYEDGVTNKARIRELTDLRSEGGYIVAMGSMSSKGEYVLLQDKPLLSFPKHLFPDKVNIFEATQSTNHRFETKELETYAGVGKGSRNDSLSRYIGYLLTQIHPSSWETEARQLIENANRANNPPLSPRELETTFNSIKQIEIRNNPLGRGNNFEQTNYQEPVIFDNGDDEVKLLSVVAKEQKINLNDVYPLGMPVFDEVYMGGAFPGDLIVIAGPQGEGKTSLAQDWTMGLLRGEKKAKSLWFSYEVLPNFIWAKFADMGMKESEGVFIPAKHSTGEISWVREKIKEAKKKFGIKAVVIDHLGFLIPETSQIFKKNMSSTYSIYLTQIVRSLKTIALAEEVIIILPTHIRKVNTYQRHLDISDIGNSSSIAQESDLVFLIERERNKDSEATEVYTSVTRIALAKNRRTGQTVIAHFTMMNGRFAYDGSREKAKKEFDAYSPAKQVELKTKELEAQNEESDEDLAVLAERAWKENVG